MAKRSSRRGRLALRMSLIAGPTAALLAVIVVVILIQVFGSGTPAPAPDRVSRAWLLGLAFAGITGIVVGGVAWALANAVAARLTDLGLAVNKLGRGAVATRVRTSGNDEVTSLGTSIQYLANDLASMFEEQTKAGGMQVGFDPQVRALRDRALPQNGVDAPAGYEADAAIANGSRGGLDYFGGIGKEDFGVLYLVSAEGAGPLAVFAARMARDELQRALDAGANARKALAHTNRVMQRVLPPTVCARASLLELMPDEIKLYQVGMRTPALMCVAGRVEEVLAEGLALGLDEGPVFEKQLRSTKIPVAQGVRVVLVNDAAARLDDLRPLIQQHSPKNTGAFMNLVLAALEADAGDDGLREDVVMLTAKRW